MALPTSWPDALARLDRQVGDGEEWLREAVEAAFGQASLYDLPRQTRALVFQKTCGVVLALEDASLPDELLDADGRAEWIVYRDGTLERTDEIVGRRVRIARVFARYFAGAALEGPPWQIAPDEDRPTREEWAAQADF